MGSLSGRKVIICGAAGGIGAAAVEGFAAAGASVCAIYNRTAPTGPLRELAHWKQCDLTDQAATETIFAQAADTLGGLDVLIQAAGTWRGGAPEDVTADDIDFLFDANVKSTIFANQAAYRLMRASGGRIVNFGSVEGGGGRAKSPVYSATRGAVHSWTRSVARAWAQHGITANSIAPAMQTPLADYLVSQLSEDERAGYDAALAARIPIGGKLGDPRNDLVPMLEFLAGDGSRFITGQIIPVDGGMWMVGA